MLKTLTRRLREGWDEHWYLAFVWLVYSLLGVILPPAVGAAFVFGLGGTNSIEGFTGNGQLAIYSLGMWITTSRLVFKGTEARLPGQEIIGLVLFFGAFLSGAWVVLGSVHSNGI